MRYSRQRHYSEVYDYRTLYRDFSVLETAETAPIPEPPVFIERHAPIAEYNTTVVSECRFIGKYLYDVNTEIKKSPYGLEGVMPVLGEFPYNEMEYIPYQYIQKCRIPMGNKTAGLPAVLYAGQFALIDLKKVCAGFITADIDALRFCSIDINNPKYSVLKNAVLNIFGPKRTTEYPEIEKSNAFIGMYVRTEVLLKLKLYDKMLSDIKGYFGYMSSSTQTLWEMSEPVGSLDHGFASYAAYAIAVAYGKDSR